MPRRPTSLPAAVCMSSISAIRSGFPVHGARSLLTKWLELFDVTPRIGLERAMKDVAFNSDGELTFSRPFRGYAQYGVLTSASHARST